MKTASTLATLSVLAVALAVGLPVWAQEEKEPDFEGSKDHPLVSRYPDSWITYYQSLQFDRYALPVGPTDPDTEKLTKTLPLEGKVTRITYCVPSSRSSLEVFKNYEAAFKKGGFQTIYAAEGETLGSAFLAAAYPRNNAGDIERTRYAAVKLPRPSGDVYAALMVTQTEGQRNEVQLDLIEVKPMEADLVKTDAAALLAEIGRTGKASVYGILFDVAKADIKPESEVAIAEIGKLLKANPGLRLFVVGHTHGIGDYAANVKLSQDRAEAVVKVLVAKHGIDAARLKAVGVGPVAPVGSNKTEEGKARNRRV
jgi:OmpA-OmpF porin, OOP family